MLNRVFSEVRQCKNCGKAFTAFIKNQRFCCVTCRYKWHKAQQRKEPVEKVCAFKYCNNKFLSSYRHQKYCSESCAKAAAKLKRTDY